MVKTRLILKSYIPKKNKVLSERVYLDGKSYKISIKSTCVNMRFNRVNKTILFGPHSQFLNKNGQKKLYLLNARLLRTPLRYHLDAIRAANTYTVRGLWSSAKPITKRAGRISEYM